MQAQTVQRVVQRKQAEATRVAQAPESAGNDLNLVRPAESLPLPPPPTAAGDPAAAESFPAPGSLTDQFAGDGALLDQVEQQRRVFAQMLRREVENTVIDARRQMNDDPNATIQAAEASAAKRRAGAGARARRSRTADRQAADRAARSAACRPRSRTNWTRPAKKNWPRPANGSCSTSAWPATAKRKSSSIDRFNALDRRTPLRRSIGRGRDRRRSRSGRRDAARGHGLVAASSATTI